MAHKFISTAAIKHWQSSFSLACASILPLIFLIPQSTWAQSPPPPLPACSTVPGNITPFISDEAIGSSITSTVRDTLPETWKTSVGIPSNAANVPWSFTALSGTLTTSTFQYQDPLTKTFSTVTVENRRISLTSSASCTAPATLTGTLPGVVIGSGLTLQDAAPSPYNAQFWNQTSQGSGSGRAAVLLTFSNPIRSFGAWFGDLESRSASTNGTPAILRLLDANGNRIGADIQILSSGIYRNSSTSSVLDETKCGSVTSTVYPGNTDIGCGNGSTRWVSFVDNATLARVKQVLIIVGSDDYGENGNLERLSFLGANFYSIAGTVFEDVNYGGGYGRSLVASGGVGRSGARVELYDSAGAFKGSTTTDANGKYIFNAATLTADTYTVRVVNSTVTSSRNATAALQPVQTFRTSEDIDNNNVWDADRNRVGGENPAKIDAPPNLTGLSLAALTTSDSTPQSITTVVVGNASGVDFGFNFDTIVNTNDAGQGSLRQFILNSNALPNTNLDQVPNPDAGTAAINPAAGEEASIFMISDGQSHPGLRSGLTNLLPAGVASIVPITQLPTVTDSKTSIDGRTQTANVGDTKSGVVGGSTVGTLASALGGISKPEVQISSTSNGGTTPIVQGLTASGNNFAVRGLSIYGFSNANIFLDGSSSSIIEQSVIGTVSGDALNTPPVTGRGLAHGITISRSATKVIVQDSLIAQNGISGIYMDISAGSNYSEVVVQRNEFAYNGFVGLDTGDGVTMSLCMSKCVVNNNYIHDNKAYGIQEYINKDVSITNNTVTRNGSGGTETSGIMVWGSTGTQVVNNIVALNAGDGIYLARFPFLATQALANQVKISQNSFFGNGNLGIDLAGPSNNAATDYRFGQTPYVTANDGAIGTTISNNGIDYPVITYSNLTAGNLTVKGFVGNTLDSKTFSGVTLEFFIADNSAGNHNGEVLLNDGKSKPHREGKTYIGFCMTDGNSQFNCSFSNAGALGLTDATQITATATDGSGNTSEFSAIPSSRANLILVKRITAITSANTGLTTTYGTFVNDPNSTEDNDLGWPSGYLVGSLNPGLVFPGDTIEYTIYYLNNGENRIGQAKVCDALNKNLNFLFDFNSSNIGKGLLLSPGGSASQYLTNVSGDDRGEYATSSPNDCNLVNNTTADRSNNTVIVEAANSSNPILGGGYGSIKFKVTIK